MESCGIRWTGPMESDGILRRFSISPLAPAAAC